MRGRRADIHDIPAVFRDEVLGRLARHQHGSGDIGGEGALKAREVDIHEFLEGTRPGVVDQNIETAKLFQNFAHGALDVGFLGHVGVNGMRA
jgi:hypothetical protein